MDGRMDEGVNPVYPSPYRHTHILTKTPGLRCVGYNKTSLAKKIAMVYQITSLAIVYSVVYSGTDQIKHQSFASLAFVRGIPHTKVQ